ncbi:response regulator transcription factor [Thermoanaerobacterium sp. RBIITD]|uniref:response regulator transcription factor n=1 Tax=Thermoanaerobacterium sp. RBIITD TaxID=1550240 RepID=UPI000BB73173|nr:response regulator transcription factor [Thermoanaerobacterium sp. RBIITD]SNX53152.1 DNA-binding response regulator, OmpR family, contains REC and winged-helix (wHTH) domain [Thermoanaerobacterium sp. RBIITD]
MENILIVDDEEMLVKGLKLSLIQEGYSVDFAYDGEEGLKKIRSGNFDLVILDLMLPKMDGLTVCREVRTFSNIPIIMLTAKGEDVDKIVGIEMGADDYLAKPFNTRELIARIRALFRRTSSPFIKKQDEIRLGDLTINIPDRLVYKNGKEVELTNKEFDLLALLASNPGKLYSKDKLMDLIWGFDFYGDTNTVNVHIRKLREKIEDDPANPKHIFTKWGSGYYMK